MSKHTPGPWRFAAICTASENHRGWNLSRDHAGFGGYIGTVSPKIKEEHGCASAEGLANARLIAAAPELLQALAAMVTAFSWGDMNDGEAAAIKEARAAIAKATGEEE